MDEYSWKVFSLQQKGTCEYIYIYSKQRNNPTIENTCKFLTGEDYADRIEHRIVSG